MTIKTIVENFEEKYPEIETEEGIVLFLKNFPSGSSADLDSIKTFLHSQLSTLLDEIEKEIQEKSFYAADCNYGDGENVISESDVLQTLNKYR